MPAAPAPEELKERVKAVALQIGVREAARQFELSEARVMQWSARGKWFAEKELVQEIVVAHHEKQQVSAAVSKSPSEIILAFGNKTKLAQAKVVHRTAKALNKKDDDTLIALHQVVKSNVDSADKLFGYTQPAPSLTQINVNLAAQDFPDSK